MTSSLCLNLVRSVSPLFGNYFCTYIFSASNITHSTHPVSAIFTKQSYDWRAPEWHRVWTDSDGLYFTGLDFFTIHSSICIYYVSLIEFGVVKVRSRLLGSQAGRMACEMVSQNIVMYVTGQPWEICGWMDGEAKPFFFFCFFGGGFNIPRRYSGLRA